MLRLNFGLLRQNGSPNWGGGGSLPGEGALAAPKEKVGLWVFMAVVTMLFAIIISAYLERMKNVDWQPLTEPTLLWLNTAFLVLASIGMQWAGNAAHRGQRDAVQSGVLAGGVFALAFIVGQLWAWRELNALGYFLDTNPASSFFYMITTLHGLHLLGGLVAWVKSAIRLRSGVAIEQLCLGVELCATYWHFLLIVWLVLFGLLLNT